MKLYELLLETTEEDRALVSLGSAICRHLYDNFRDVDIDTPEYDPDFDDTDTSESHEAISVGTIGQIFNTPLDVLTPVHIFVQSDYGLRERARSSNAAELLTRPEDGAILGLWYNDNMVMILNQDFIGSNSLKKAIVHELRHALDDFKSDFKAGRSEYYARPKNKDHRKDSTLAYKAGPDEINARFLEVLSNMTVHIKRAFTLPPAQIKPAIMKKFREELEKGYISQLFPEKEQSAQYKRLIKRAMDFISKEVSYNERLSHKSGSNKVATGSYSD